MGIYTICLIIFIGLILLVIELVLIPGISIAGIGSFIFITSGIIASYIVLGAQTGNIVLISTIIAVVATIYFTLKPKTWNRFSLDVKIDSKAVDTLEHKFKVGDEGIAVSRLAPSGNIMINNEIVEAHTISEFIDVNCNVIVTSVEGTRIIVKIKK